MARISDIFAGRTLEATLKRARYKLASGELNEANRIVCLGLERFPEAEMLREVQLTIRRIQARSAIQDLKKKIVLENNPVGHEQLITLYEEIDMPSEAKRAAIDYAEAHPERDTPHLMLGEIYLQMFFEDLRARDAHDAHEHLLRAGRLNPEAVKPRLLLGELYYCIGANRALSIVGRALQHISGTDEAIQSVLDLITDVADPETTESVDGLLTRCESERAFARDPSTWPLRNRRNREAQVREERIQAVVERLVRENVVDDVVVLRRNETPLVVVEFDRHTDDGLGGRERPVKVRVDEAEIENAPLVDVVRTIAKTVSQQAREFDLGAFKRCSIEGKLGLVVVGRASNVIVGAHRSRTGEPLRLWERLSVALDGVSQGGIS